MSLEPITLLLIVLVGLATYGTRLAGYWLLRNVTITGRTKAALDAVPPAILVAVIAPAVFMQGPAESMAGLVTATAALFRMPLLLTILVGVLSVVVFRSLMPLDWCASFFEPSFCGQLHQR
jgi:uncharacterized membrane protein